MIELNRIYQQDCLEGMKAIEDKSVDMILCDLPYGTTQNKWDSQLSFAGLWENYKRIIKDNGCIALTAQTPFDKVLGCSNLQWLRYEWIWVKSPSTGWLNAKKAPLKKHENVLVFYNKLPTYNPIFEKGEPYTRGPRKQCSNYGKMQILPPSKVGEQRYPSTVLNFSQDMGAGTRLHPTQKPVALFEYLIKTYTNEGETVLDNCMGSGTTAIACINTNRNFIGFETEAKYVNIANQRIQDSLLKQAA